MEHNTTEKYNVNNKVTLKEYICHKISSLRDEMNIKFDSIEKANVLSSAVLDERLVKMNEFRNTLKDQATSFITREEVTARFDKQYAELKFCIDTIEKDIVIIKESLAEAKGKATQGQVNIATLIAVIAVTTAIASIVLRGFGI